MTDNIRHLIAILAATASVVCIYADDTSRTRVVSGYVNLNDSANVYQALSDNTPIEPEFKLAPKFAIIGADNKFVFSLGAQMKFTASYDWGNPVMNPGGMGPSDITEPLTSDHNLYQMTAGGSNIYLNVIGFPNTANEIGLFISIGLDADANNSYRLNAGQIYMRYHDFQCGYANSLYNDRRADAFTIDGHGPCASGGYTTVGINWQHYTSSHIRLGIGVEIPKTEYTQISVVDMPDVSNDVIYNLTSNQYIPNFPLYIGYAWPTGHVRLSSILRGVHYINLLNGDSHDVFGYGIKLTGNADMGPVSLFWMGQFGHATASTFKDDSNSGLDLVPDDRAPGRLRATNSAGLIAGAQWNVTPKIFTTLQCSYLRNFIPRYEIPALETYDAQMRYGFTYMANAVWKISSLFSTGIEYRHATRCNESGERLSDNRIYAMLLMNF